MSGFAPYRKTLVAAASAGLIAAQTALPLSPTWHGAVTVALAVLGAGGVYQVRNAPLKPVQPVSRD